MKTIPHNISFQSATVVDELRATLLRAEELSENFLVKMRVLVPLILSPELEFEKGIVWQNVEKVAVVALLAQKVQPYHPNHPGSPSRPAMQVQEAR